MTDHSPAVELSTLDARRGSFNIELSDDALSYRAVRVFGAPPERVYRAFTHPDDLRVWFPGGAPPGSEMTVCESDPTEGGRYLYRMTVPDFGPMAWFGNYTAVDAPNQIDAEEWFVMGEGDPEGPPAVQTLTFEPTSDGQTLMTLDVRMPSPEDPDTFLDQAGAGLGSSLAVLDEMVSAS
ncbi:MAG: hypothetical protein EX269_10085 [Acidimicrobiales bacterium]|nr:MAG: hypothetical protein EX269_10085 [Acidimicrobiales bacterium]